MNLRLDRNTMRIRVSYEEVVELFEKGELSEKFPLFYQSIELCIFCSQCKSLIAESNQHNKIEIYIPIEWLKEFLSNNNLKRSSKAQFEMVTQFKNTSHSFDIRFEIDQFTLNRK